MINFFKEGTFWIIATWVIISVILLYILFFVKEHGINTTKVKFHNKYFENEGKKVILEQMLDQWKTRENHLWANIYGLFYALILLLFLPFLGLYVFGSATMSLS